MSNYEEQYRGTYNLVKEEQDLREDLREGISLRDATNDGLRKEIASLRTANDRLEADLMLANAALADQTQRLILRLIKAQLCEHEPFGGGE